MRRRVTRYHIREPECTLEQPRLHLRKRRHLPPSAPCEPSAKRADGPRVAGISCTSNFRAVVGSCAWAPSGSTRLTPSGHRDAIICFLPGARTRELSGKVLGRAPGIAMPGVATLNAVPGLGSFSLFGRNCVHGPALTLVRKGEALVAVFGDLGA